MNYLILGSNSFAGSSFVNYLLSRDEKVVGISRSAEPHPIMQPYYHHPNKRYFHFLALDLNNHFNDIINTISKYKPRYIIDFAGQGMVAESWSDPAQWYLTNIVSKVKLHHYLKDCDFLERYVRVSTPEVYGSNKTKIKENQQSNPSTPYAVSHSAIDMSLKVFFKQYCFPFILARFANFYGPYQQLYRIVPRTIIYALINKKLLLQGRGTSERMFIYIDDIADAIYRTIHKGKSGQIYHFSSEPCLSIKSLIEKICALMHVDIYTLIEMTEERAGKDNKYEMDCAKSKKELGWEPSYTLENGLEKTIEWVKKYIDIIKTLPLDYTHKS